MLYKMIQGAPLVTRFITLFVSLFLYISCTKKNEKEYYVSYQEIVEEIDSIEESFEKNKSDPVIALYNSKNDTVFVAILNNEIKTIRKNNKNINHYTSFTSLASVVQILKTNNFDSLPARNEKYKPKIFFIDVQKSKIKIIPGKQVFEVSKDDLSEFH